MAFGDERVLLKGIRGKIGKQLVIKQYADKIVIARYPSMPTRKQVSPKKRRNENKFKDAINYAKLKMRDKNLKAQIAAKLPPGKRVYNYLVKEYLNMPVPPVPGPAE